MEPQFRYKSNTTPHLEASKQALAHHHVHHPQFSLLLLLLLPLFLPITSTQSTSHLPILLHPLRKQGRLPQTVPIKQRHAILQRGQHGLLAALLYLGVVARDGGGDCDCGRGGGGVVDDYGAELLDELGGVVDGVVEALATV